MDSSQLGKHMKKFAECASIRKNDFSALVVLRVVFSFIGVDKEKTYNDIVQSENATIDWNFLQTFTDCISLTEEEENNFWVAFFRLFKFVDEPPLPDEIEQHLLRIGLKVASSEKSLKISPIQHVHISLYKMFQDSLYWLVE